MDLGLYVKISRMNTKQLYVYLHKFLKTAYEDIRVDGKGNYIMAKGQSSVCLVAHLDTVFPKAPRKIYRAKDNPNILISLNENVGLGADDRAGVYAILTLLKQGLRPSVIFTTGEEMGGIGARKLIEDYPKIDDMKISCLIQLDRKGSSESVFYNCANKEFEAFINEFGFKTNFGSFSDISILAPEWKIAAVNLSVGFEHEHTIKETLNIQYLQETIEKVRDIIESEPAAYEYVEEEKSISLLDLFKSRHQHPCIKCTTFDCDSCYFSFTWDDKARERTQYGG